jgi:hypothetical protein
MSTGQDRASPIWLYEGTALPVDSQGAAGEILPAPRL